MQSTDRNFEFKLDTSSNMDILYCFCTDRPQNVHSDLLLTSTSVNIWRMLRVLELNYFVCGTVYR